MDLNKFRQDLNIEKQMATSTESPELSMVLEKAQVSYLIPMKIFIIITNHQVTLALRGSIDHQWLMVP